jgi:hypothetical protein
MKTTSSPSSKTALKVVMKATLSSELTLLPRSRRMRSDSFTNASASSCKGSTPAWRSTAFLSQRKPNISSNTPTTS